MEQTAGIRD